MTSPSQLPDQDFELLNAYLDDQLSPSARTALEQRLAAEQPLRAALDELQQTVRFLKAAPRLATPRNFTLDPARYGRRAPWWARSGAMQLIGAIGAAASVILIVLGVAFSSARTAPTSMSAAQFPSRNAVAANVTATNTPIPNTVQDQAAILASTATSSLLTPKVKQSGQAIGPALEPTLLPVFPTATPQALPPTLQAFAAAATPIPTATALTSNSAAPAGPIAPRPNSALNSSSGSGGAQNNGQVFPSNAPPSQTDELSGGIQPTEPPTETRQTSARDMTQVAQQAKSNAQLQATASPDDNKDQAAAGNPAVQTGAAEAATAVATSEALSPTPIASTTASFTPSPQPTTVPTGIAAVPTALDKGTASDYAAQQASPQVPILLVAGIALLVFSVMLFALGWLRSRLSRQDR